MLFLGLDNNSLVTWLESTGEEVISTTNPVSNSLLKAASPDFIVSYGYRYILSGEILNRYENRAINMHISYLPWNRGADPNLWSFIEGTPKGVTIHYLDEGVDTGDIIAQRIVTFDETDTLRTSYHKLQNEIQELFKENWQEIRAGKCYRTRQVGSGTFHRKSDRESISQLLVDRWDTKVVDLEKYSMKT